MKYNKLIKRFGNWFLPRISRYDWGYKHPDDGPKSFHTNIRICECLGRGFAEGDGDKRSFLNNLTKTDLHNHVYKNEVEYFGMKEPAPCTLYYRSCRKAPVITVMADFDAHGGQTDVWEAAGFVQNKLFPGAYLEPSTGGKGVHGYIHLEVEFSNRRAVNQLLHELADALDAILYNEKFESNLCMIGGNYTLLTERRCGLAILKGDRGKLGKIPRLLKGEDDLAHLIDSEVFGLDRLQKIIELAASAPRRPDPKKNTDPHHTTKTVSVSLHDSDLKEHSVSPRRSESSKRRKKHTKGHTSTTKTVSVCPLSLKPRH